MFLYDDRSIFCKNWVRVVNFILLGLCFLADLDDSNHLYIIISPSALLWTIIASIVVGGAIYAHASSHTDFYTDGQRDWKETNCFNYHYLFLALFFAIILGLSIFIGINSWKCVEYEHKWIIFLPSLIYLVNLLNIPTLHWYAFGELLK